MSNKFFAYILLCGDNSYYTGHTDDLQKRYNEHACGEGCTYTSKRLPVTMMWSQEFDTREEAKEAEARIKGWSRKKKQALIEGDYALLKVLASRSTQSRALRDARKAHSSGTLDST